IDSITIYLHGSLFQYPVAVFLIGVRGARLVPLESPQNQFDVHRSAKSTANFRHWIGRGPQSNFMPVASY
ncbi:hypothetical protein AVEN_144473-1, partial [Araneus ventricosus]